MSTDRTIDVIALSDVINAHFNAVVRLDNIIRPPPQTYSPFVALPSRKGEIDRARIGKSSIYSGVSVRARRGATT